MQRLLMRATKFVVHIFDLSNINRLWKCSSHTSLCPSV